MVFWKYILRPTRKFQVDHQFSQVNVGLWLYIALYVHTECKPCWKVFHKMCWICFSYHFCKIGSSIKHMQIAQILSDSKLLRSPNSSASFSQKIQSYWEPCLYRSLQWGQRPSVCSTSAGGPKWRSKFMASCHQNINDVGTQLLGRGLPCQPLRSSDAPKWKQNKGSSKVEEIHEGPSFTGSIYISATTWYAFGSFR